MPINCEIPNPSRKKYGYPEAFVSKVKSIFGEPTNRASLRNLARKLGVDDVRTLNLKGEDGKYLFSKALTDATDWKAGKQVAKDVVVTVPDQTGGERWFMSAKSTDTPPQKWVESNGSVLPNPDWDMVGQNKTIRPDGSPNLYVKDFETGYYRLPRGDESGEYILNVQNTTRPLDNLTNDKIVSNNIDAIEHAPQTFELVHEPSQAYKLGKGDIYQKDVSDALSKQVNKTNPDEDTVIERLKELGVPSQVASTIAGGIAGSLVDSEDQFGGTFWGGALGFALGTRKFRTRMKGAYTKVKSGKDPFDEAAITELRAQKQKDILERAHAVDFVGDDPERAREYMENYGLQLERDRAVGKNPKDSLFKNDWFESLRNILTSLNIPQANSMYRVFQDFGSVSSNTFGILNNIQAKYGGKQKVLEDIRTGVKRFYSEFENVDDQVAEDAFGDAVRRIRTFGVNIDEQGNFRYDESMTAARKEYQDGRNVSFDRYILENEELTNALRSYGEYYDSNLNIFLKDIDERINDVTDNVVKGVTEKAVLKLMYEEAVENGHGTSSFIKMYPESKKLVEQAKSTDAPFAQTMQMIDDYVRFKEFEGRYVPQQMDREAMSRMRKDFLSNPTKYDQSYSGRPLSELSDKEQDKAWNRYVTSRILENHRDKWKALTYTEDGGTNVRYYKSSKEAEEIVDTLPTRLRDAQIVGEVSEDLSKGNYDQYIRSTKNAKGEEIFYLETPDKFKNRNINVFEEDNIEKLATSFRTMETRSLRYFSNHYDRPRNYILPSEFLLTDMERLARNYASDIGPRIHNIRNKMYNTAEFNREWLDPIEKELQTRKGADTKFIDKTTDRIKSWYGAVQGIRKDIKLQSEGMSEEDIAREWQKNALNEKLWTAGSKLATQGFLYGVTHYAPFQPAVVMPFFVGWKNTKNGYGYYLRNPKALKTITDELMAIDSIRKTLEGFSPEFKNEVRRQQLSEVIKPWHEKVFNTADKLVDFSGNFSFAKPFLSYFGRDIEDMGLARLFVGSMYDISGAEAGISTMMMMRHVEDLVEGFSKINAGAKTVDINGVSFSKNQLLEELSEMGVRNPETFLKEKKKFNQYIKYLGDEAERPEMSNQLYQEFTNIMNRAVDLYHARDKTIRPLHWLNNVFGQVFSRFSTYSQNIAVNVTRGRIYRPMADWHERYTPLMQQDKDANFMKIAYWASTRNDAKFKEVFGENWEDAYNEFPVHAVNNAFKVLGAIGVGHVMMLSRSAQIDLISMATNEAIGNDDYEQWRSFKKRITYEDPETGEQVNVLNALGDGVQLFDVMKLLNSSFAMSMELGGASKWGTLVTQDLKYTQGGPADAFPLGGMATSAYESIGRLIHNTNLEDYPRQIAKEFTSIGLNYAPIIGTYHDVRKGIENTVFQKPSSRGIQYRDVADGSTLDIEGFEF